MSFDRRRSSLLLATWLLALAPPLAGAHTAAAEPLPVAANTASAANTATATRTTLAANTATAANTFAVAPTAAVAPTTEAAPTTLAVVSQMDGVLRLLSTDQATQAQGPTGAAAPAPTVALGDKPAGIALDPDGRTLYITDPDHGRVSVVDSATRRVTARFAVGGQPFGAAASASALYVTDWARNLLLRLEPASGEKLAQIQVGKSPAGVVLDRAGRHAFVAAREADAVSVVDLDTDRETQRIAVGRAPFALTFSPDGTRLYVANVQSGDLSVIDVGAAKEIARVRVGEMPYGVIVTPDGGRIAVTLQHEDAVALVDATTLLPAGKIKVGSYPEGIALLPDGRTAAVANWYDDTVSVVDLGAARVIATLTAAGGPRNLTAIPAAAMPPAMRPANGRLSHDR